jgi:hypothetical protein
MGWDRKNAYRFLVGNLLEDSDIVGEGVKLKILGRQKTPEREFN